MLFIVTLKVIIIKNKILVKTFLKMLFGGLNFFWVIGLLFSPLEVKCKAVSYNLEAEKNLRYIFFRDLCVSPIVWG